MMCFEKVAIKDRDMSVEQMRMILGMLGYRFEYQDVDLINRAMEVFDKKGGDTALDDITVIRHEWEQHWVKYKRPKIDIKTEKDE